MKGKKTQKPREALEKEGKRDFELKQKIPTISLILLLLIRENEGQERKRDLKRVKKLTK